MFIGSATHEVRESGGGIVRRRAPPRSHFVLCATRSNERKSFVTAENVT